MKVSLERTRKRNKKKTSSHCFSGLPNQPSENARARREVPWYRPRPTKAIQSSHNSPAIPLAATGAQSCQRSKAAGAEPRFFRHSFTLSRESTMSALPSAVFGDMFEQARPTMGRRQRAPFSRCSAAPFLLLWEQLFSTCASKRSERYGLRRRTRVLCICPPE